MSESRHDEIGRLHRRLEALERRIGTLQRQNRRLGLGALTVLLLAITGLTVGAARPADTMDFDVVRAKHYVLLDDQGRERGLWENDREAGRDSTQFVIQNPNGKKQCVLGSNYFADGNQSTTFLDMFHTDEDTIANAGLGCSGDGSDIFLQSAEQNDIGFAMMSYGSSGSGVLLTDGQRKHWVITSSRDNATEVVLTDEDKGLDATLSLSGRRESVMERASKFLPKRLPQGKKKVESGYRPKE